MCLDNVDGMSAYCEKHVFIYTQGRSRMPKDEGHGQTYSSMIYEERSSAHQERQWRLSAGT
jgi:hypothetical protein